MLTIDWMTGRPGAMWLIVWRIVQGIGAAFIIANSGAILTDAFPSDQRGLALGINNVAGISGSFIGLVLGGILAPINWRLIFLISVPIGLAGTVWAYKKLEDRGARQKASIDWPGNITFAVGLILVMIGITYGIQPYAGHPWAGPTRGSWPSWSEGSSCSPRSCVIETRVDNPMFKLSLVQDPRVYLRDAVDLPVGGGPGRADVHADHLAPGDLAAPPRLQLRADPVVGGHLHAAADRRVPDRRARLSGYLSDRYGARPFATGGMLVAALSFGLAHAAAGRLLLPGVRAHPPLERSRHGLLRLAQPGRGDEQPPPGDRGAGGGMNSTFQNSAQVLSIGIFFTLMISGLAASLPSALQDGLMAHGVGRLDRPPGRQPPSGLGSLRGVPRVQPGSTAGAGTRARSALADQLLGGHRTAASSPT